MSHFSPISQQIWDMKYRLKAPGGEARDKTLKDTWQRVAKTLASVEKDPALWQGKFYTALEDFRFLPAGRIIAGAGADRKVTLFNCFVMGDIPDDMAGIFDGLKEAALTLQQGGGIGYDFSTLRPKGAVVKGVGADASGPLTFMDVWDAMCRTVMSAGSRRGAMMATMRCDHPDIEAFIEAKRTPGRLRMFNLSVLVSDDFMQAVKMDESWELVFGGVVYKSLPARHLWDRIMQATYAYAEPGVIFIDRINKANNLHYCETIHATNPCVSADTWVHTVKGPKQVHDLLGRQTTLLVNGTRHTTAPEGFFKSGTKPVLRLSTREGYELTLTEDHPLRLQASGKGGTAKYRWEKCGNLQLGDRILLNNHRNHPHWPGLYNQDHGYLIGLLLGDGVLKDDKAVLSVWTSAAAIGADDFDDGTKACMARALEAATTFKTRSDFDGWSKVAGRDEYRLSFAGLKTLAENLGMTMGAKVITPQIEKTSSDFYIGFLQGLFDADGSVQGSQDKGVSVRLAQSNEDTLLAVQRMLLRMSIKSSIYKNRREAQSRLLPDGKGGHASYMCQAQHELVIANDNLGQFHRVIGFVHAQKRQKLDFALKNYKRQPNREDFCVTLHSLTPAGVEDVFDVTVPGLNAFDANGFYAHNCGEQPLPPYGTCLLGSINLARLVKNPFEENAHIDEGELSELVGLAVRMLDNVIEVSNYPLDAQRHEAQTKRRLGLGITGLADALIMCGARYGGEIAVKLCSTWMKLIQRAAYLTSSDLAEEKGSFELFDAKQLLESDFAQSLDDDIRQKIATQGLRNSHLLSIAPTGTISLLADNVSSGLEPVFSFTYSRSVLLADGTRRQENVSDYAYRLFQRLKGESTPLPSYFVDAQQLSPKDHLIMQATIQGFIDSSISKTINCPEGIAFDDFKDIYRQAYDMGCKGCTTYRPNDVTGSVLSLNEPSTNEASDAQGELPLERASATIRPRDAGDAGVFDHLSHPLSRPEVLPGQTYKIRWPESEHALYITLNDVIEDGVRRPFEIFINSKNMEHYAWTVALTRMISAVFRRGGQVSFVVEELKAVFDPRGGQWMSGRYVPSLLAAIGEVIEEHMIASGFIQPNDLRPISASAGSEALMTKPTSRLRPCPKCGHPSLIRQEGCDTCTNCGYSKCG